MVNINKTNPNWLKMFKLPKDFGLNMVENNSGANLPKIEGPSMIPAMISPMTVGWPIFPKNQPKILATNRMAKSCNNNMAAGSAKFSVVISRKLSQESTLLE